MAIKDKQQRKLAREAVLQALYAKHVSNEEPKKVLHDIFIRYEFDKMIYLKSYDISHKVTISSAIENAKKFSSEDSTSFVNGVLDSIYKEL